MTTNPQNQKLPPIIQPKAQLWSINNTLISPLTLNVLAALHTWLDAQVTQGRGMLTVHVQIPTLKLSDMLPKDIPNTALPTIRGKSRSETWALHGHSVTLQVQTVTGDKVCAVSITGTCPDELRDPIVEKCHATVEKLGGTL